MNPRAEATKSAPTQKAHATSVGIISFALAIILIRWRKPAALLINEGTRSGKEVLTYGFKKNGFGPVVGERTAGALLAGTAFLLSDGSLLILAVDDAAVDGERLEGTGVVPTVEVPFDIRYANGKDPQLDRAVELLAQGA